MSEDATYIVQPGDTPTQWAEQQGAALAALRAELTQVWALALAEMPDAQKQVVRALATRATGDGWANFAALFADVPDPWFPACRRLEIYGVIEARSAPNGGTRYRLTDLGKMVAAALQEAARV